MERKNGSWFILEEHCLMVYGNLSVMYRQYAEQDKSVVSTSQIEEIGFLEGEFQTRR